MEKKDLEQDNMEEYEDFQTIILTLEDDTEVECAVIDMFEVDGISYVALLPIEDLEDENNSVLLYRFKELDNDEIEIDMIESDEEFEKVAEAFNQLVEEDEEDDDCGCSEGHNHHHHDNVDGQCQCGCNHNHKHRD